MTESTSLRRSLMRQFLLVGLLPLGVVMSVVVALLVPALLQQGEVRNLELATAVRDQVQKELSARLRAASLVAAEVGAGRVHGAALMATLHELVDRDDLVLAAYLTDRLGIIEQIALPEGSAQSEAHMIGLDQSAHPHFREALRSGQPVWSETFLSALTGRVTAVLVVPAGERMLIAELALDQLSKSLAEIGRAAQTQSIVIDRAGRVIGHPDAALALRQENLSHYALVRRAIEGHSGAASIDFGGTSQLAQALPVALVGWTILVMQPTHLVLSPLFTLGWVLAVVLVAMLLSAMALSWWLARRSGREVERLAQAAEGVVYGPAAAASGGSEGGAEGGTAGVSAQFHISEFRSVWVRLQALFAELHQRDQQTESARRDLQAVLDAATEVAIVATDIEGCVTVFSLGAQKMLLRPAHGVIGHVTPVVWHDAHELRARAEELTLQLGRPIGDFESLVCQARHAGYEVRDWTFLRSDGQRLDVSLAVTAMRNAAGAITGFLGVAIDVSQRRRADALELARLSAEAANQAKSEFLSRMSHELRTPLNAVLGYAQLIELNVDEPITANQQRHLAQIQRSGWHLVQLIDDVLDLARIESGHLRVSLVPLDARDAVARALEMATPQLRQHGVSFQVVWGDAQDGRTFAPVLADMTRLVQVLVNLLSNAAKYNRPGGSLTLSCDAALHRGVRFGVSDTGMGMDADQLAHLFEPFNRLGREASTVEGTGIGLVITQRLLAFMNSALDVRSTPGEGSVFSFVLPQEPPAELLPETPNEAPNEAAHETAQHANQDAEHDSQQDSQQKAPGSSGLAPAAPLQGCVLYIEDNAVNATLMRELMRQRPAVRLLQAETAAQGVALARQHLPQLILLDMHLPDADGFSVLNALAQEPALVGVPVIAISADATRAQINRTLAHGARDYLAKPINVAEVLAQIDRALGPLKASP